MAGKARRSRREIVDKPTGWTTRSEPKRDRAARLHDVHVYEEELLAQNVELRRTQSALEDSRERLSELYDFAPNGYLTLDLDGVVTQINLTGTMMFGQMRQKTEGLALLSLIALEDR